MYTIHREKITIRHLNSDKGIERQGYVIRAKGHKIAERETIKEARKTLDVLNEYQKGEPNVKIIWGRALPKHSIRDDGGRFKKGLEKTLKKKIVSDTWKPKNGFKSKEEVNAYNRQWRLDKIQALIKSGEYKVKVVKNEDVYEYVLNNPGISKIVIANHFQISTSAVNYHFQQFKSKLIEEGGYLKTQLKTEDVYAYLNANPGISKTKIAKHFNVTPSAITYHFQQFKSIVQ